MNSNLTIPAIGQVWYALTPYFNTSLQKNSFKKRPVLIIGIADVDDYVCLPISSISFKNNVNPYYDIEIDIFKYPNLNLNKISYIRTHKQCIIHRKELHVFISDAKNCYNDLYLEVITKLDEFNNQLIENAL